VAAALVAKHDAPDWKCLALPVAPAAVGSAAMRTAQIALLAVVMLLAGCAGSNYSSADNMWHLGFSETQLAPDTWRVTYKGHQIAMAKATDFALLRSAELCLQAGFTHFTVTGQNGQTTSGPGMIIPSGNVALYSSTQQPEITLTIQCGPEKPGAYSASFLQQSLKKKYDIDEED
jgi:hypothetical protein